MTDACGVTRHSVAPSGAVSPQAADSSSHTPFLCRTFSSDNFDFLWFSEDSEPFIGLDLWRLVCNYHKAQHNVLQFIRNLEKII